MEETIAGEVVDRLRDRGVMAHVHRAGVYRFGVRVVMRDGREAIWDADGTAGIEAQIMRDGILVGFIPTLPGSEDFGADQIVAAIAAADYDNPETSDPGAALEGPKLPISEHGGTFETRPRVAGPVRGGLLSKLGFRR